MHTHSKKIKYNTKYKTSDLAVKPRKSRKQVTTETKPSKRISRKSDTVTVNSERSQDSWEMNEYPNKRTRLIGSESSYKVNILHPNDIIRQEMLNPNTYPIATKQEPADSEVIQQNDSIPTPHKRKSDSQTTPKRAKHLAREGCSPGTPGGRTGQG